MKIKYSHASDPEKAKIHDTEKVRGNTFHNLKTPKYVDDLTLELFERDKRYGVVLNYEVIKENAKQ